MNKRTRIDRVIGATIGLTGFLIAIDPRVLNPTDDRWLLWGDSAQHYLGWQFFRNTPLIQWPIGANPAFGAGFGESIVYSDAIPLVAIPLKYGSFLLPSTFQYLGWWVLVCFLLQGAVGFSLLRFAGVTRCFSVLGTVMLVLFPPFLYRLTHEGYGHIALASHWIILLSILMFVSRDDRLSRWTLVAAIALLVQPYLAVFPLVLGTWRLIRYQPSSGVKSIYSVPTRLTVFIGVPTVIFWVVGGFPSGASRDTGFGVYQATLTSLVDPGPTSSFGWSRLLNMLDFQALPATNEGFAFLGTGILLLFPLALVAWPNLRRKPNGDWNSLFAIGALFALFAVLPTIRVGERTMFTVPIPERFLDFAGIFRSNGRFIWLLAYTITILVVAVVALSTNRVVQVGVCLGAVLIGLVDAQPALRETRERFSSSAEPLIAERNAAVWKRMLSNRQHLVTIPPLNNDPQWIDMAQLAQSYGMTSTAAYLSRLNISRFRVVGDFGEAALQRREFPTDSVFILMNYPPHPLTEVLRREAADIQRAHLFRAEQVENLLVVYTPASQDQ